MKELSLSGNVRSEIGNFLQTINFNCSTAEYNDAMKDGLLEVIDMLSDYYEEGTHLFPTVVFFDKMDYLKTFPNLHYLFYHGGIEKHQFKSAIRMCAPLALDGWCIFIQVGQNDMSWGVVTAEVKETSLSLEEQILRTEDPVFKVCLISNIGLKTVAMVSSGRKANCIVYLSLLGQQINVGPNMDVFFDSVLSDCENANDEFKGYFVKVVNTALHEGHGNLFAVLREGQPIPNILQEGVTIEGNPVDFLLTYSELQQDLDGDDKVRINSKLKMMSNLAVSMMNHDGVTLFTTTGKIIGYHYIVDNKITANVQMVGGARTKAFYALVNSKAFVCVLMKKQEGEINCEANNE